MSLLTVTGLHHLDERGNQYLTCQCACGKTKAVRRDHIRSGRVISCGCENARRSSERAALRHRTNPEYRAALRAAIVTHGDTQSVEYRTWCHMKSRCTNSRTKDYPNYGGRGITVCARWQSYADFLQDMGRKPSPAHSIDRINVDGNYEPTNCRWATVEEQANNKRNSKKH